MTVSTTNRLNSFTGDGITDTFTFDFETLDAADIEAYEDGVQDLNITVLLNADQTANPGGTCKFATAAPAAASEVAILRNVTADQQISYPLGGNFPSASHEGGLDKLTMLTQENHELASRGLHFPEYETSTSPVALPKRSDRASKYLAFDSYGDYSLLSGTTADPNAMQKPLIATENNIATFDSSKGVKDSGVSTFNASNNASNKTAAAAFDIAAGTRIFIESLDGGWFIAKTGAAAGTYSDNGGSFCGTVFIPTGGDGSTAWVRDYNGAVNVKWFGVKIDNTTDDAPAFQTCLDYIGPLGLEGHAPAGNYKLDAKLVFDYIIKFSGAGKATVFNFSMTTGNAVEIATNAGVVGLILENFRIAGTSDANVASPTQSLIGLNLNPSGAQSCTRNTFRNIQAAQVHTAFYTSSAWSNHFDSCLASQVYRAVYTGTGTNGVLFTALWAANCRKWLEASNAENVSFNTPLWQNCGSSTGEGAGITLFQSQVTMIAPYIEHTAVDAIANIGSNAEASSSQSSLTILGGELNEGAGSNVITIGQSGVHINIDGIRTKTGGLKLGTAGSPGTPVRLEWLTKDSTFKPFGSSTSRTGTVVAEMLPNNNGVFTKGGGAGGILTQSPVREGYRLLQTDTTNRGPIITTDLVVGDWYTIVTAMRYPATISASLDNKDTATGTSSWALSLPDTPLLTEDFEYHYFFFKAEADQLYMNLSASGINVQIEYFGVYKDIYMPDIEGHSQPIVYDTAAPTVGTWEQGDTCWNQSAASGSPIGWRCTVSGTPGTWVAMANL